MKEAAVLLLVFCFVSSQVFPQSKSRHKIGNSARATKSKQVQKPSKSASIVGLDFCFVTPDHAGGVWITGNAYLLRGLMVNDRHGRVSAITSPSVWSISQPVLFNSAIGWKTYVIS